MKLREQKLKSIVKKLEETKEPEQKVQITKEPVVTYTEIPETDYIMIFLNNILIIPFKYSIRFISAFFMTLYMFDFIMKYYGNDIVNSLQFIHIFTNFVSNY